MHRRSLLALPLLALPATLRAQARPRVVASFSILGDMVRQVAGDRVELRTIAGPNVDAHSFQPRPSDAEAVRGAALVCATASASMAGWTGWSAPRATAARSPPRPTGSSRAPCPRIRMAILMVAARSGGSRTASGRGWCRTRMPGRTSATASATSATSPAALAAADPAGAAEYEAAAARTAARLADLDGWVRSQLASVPEARRKVVTSHDAFGYFGAAYGVGFVAPQGVSTEAEPSAAAVANLIRQVRAEGITAVFLENMGNPATLERLAREAGVRVRGRLYADALSPPDGPAPTYEAMFRHNVALLVPAMRGDAS
jgi:zinc/manganese transport system substrate-binding protein